MRCSGDHKTVGILVGGPGAESSVSLASGRFLFRAFPRERATPFFVYLNKELRASLFWDDGFIQGSGNLLSVKDEQDSKPLDQFFTSLPTLGVNGESILGFLPVIHGTFGEDGRILAFLESLNHRVAGCGVESSMICFDKVLTKLVLRDYGLPVCDFSWFVKGDTCARPFAGQVLYIKPARQGSSIGVSRVAPDGDFSKAVERAFDLDSKILVEPEVEGRELECALLQKEGVWIASNVGEVRGADKGFYSFEEKYESASSVSTTLADLSSGTHEKIQSLAKEAMRVLQGRGMARVDFFLSSSGELYINEVNTLPGLTGISMFPFLLENSGFPAPILIHAFLDQLEEKNGNTR